MEITQHGYGFMDTADNLFLRLVFQTSLIKIYPLQKVMYCSNHKVRLKNFLLFLFPAMEFGNCDIHQAGSTTLKEIFGQQLGFSSRNWMKGDAKLLGHHL